MKLNLPKILSDVKLSTSKHAPQILVGLGVAGSIAATVFAIKATPKAIKLVEERKEKENKEHLTPLETIETTWKCYVPSAVILLTSAACTIGSCSMSTKRYAALTAAYKIAETTYNDYHEKVVETIGEEKNKEIKDSIAKERVISTPPSKSKVIDTGRGNVLCLDSLSGRYFRSSSNAIIEAQNLINKKLNSNLYVSLNELYDELGLERTLLGDELGWSSTGILLDLSNFDSEIVGGEPVLVVNYNRLPVYDYESLY